MQRRKRARGFSLIELMIAVAIIGLLAAVAFPAYENYARTSETARVRAHHELAVRYVGSRFALYRTRVAMGLTIPLPEDDAGWIELINANNVIETDGDLAFVSGAADGAAIGIAAEGAVADGDLAVTITMDEFNGAPALSRVVRLSEF